MTDMELIINVRDMLEEFKLDGAATRRVLELACKGAELEMMKKEAKKW
jgi:hypothetical protein